MLLAGCAPMQQPQPPATHVNLSGFSLSFKEGYADGCESAGARRQRRQVERYKSDADYRQGWNDGLSACRRR